MQSTIFRNSERTDVQHIEKLITPEVKSTFDRVNVAKIIERSLISLTLIDFDGNPNGCLCLADYPNTLQSSKAKWIDWFAGICPRLDDVSTRNSLFIHLLILPVDRESDYLTKVALDIYKSHPQLDTLLLIVNDTVDLDAELATGGGTSLEKLSEVPSLINIDDDSNENQDGYANTGSSFWARESLCNTADKPDVSNELVHQEELNAIAIQLFVVQEEFESRSIDLLPLLFNEFPDVNYAFITVPRMSLCFNLLSYFYQCRIRRNRDPDTELFVIHRDSLVDDFSVRQTKFADEAAILELVDTMHVASQKLICHDLQLYLTDGRDLNGTSMMSYVAEAGGKIIGIVILKDETNLEWIGAHYNVCKFISPEHHAYYEQATLLHCLISANYYNKHSFFLREVLRLSNKTCIYFKVPPPHAKDDSLHSDATLINTLADFRLVPPRVSIQYPKNEFCPEKMPKNCMLRHVKDPPGLFIATPKLLMQSKLTINARIIVVGASTTGLSFLETLLTCPWIRFTNLVLLSKHGIPGNSTDKPNPVIQDFMPSQAAKKITISNEHELSYDYMVLTPGLQYHASVPTGADINRFSKTSEAPFCPLRRYSVEFPDQPLSQNLFLINDWLDVERVVDWVTSDYLPLLPQPDNSQVDHSSSATHQDASQLLIDSSTATTTPTSLTEQANRIVVYGYTLEAYTCINGLLKLGIPGFYIVMVQPPRFEEVSPGIPDDLVRQAIHKEMTSLGVAIVTGYTLARWNTLHQTSVSVIEEVAFTSEHKPLKIKCKAFFCFFEKSVDYSLFNVDDQWHTNDPAIKAAGPVTKLKRAYYNDLYTDRIGDSMEVGKELGIGFLDLFDPTKPRPVKPEIDVRFLLPQYEMPKLHQAILPNQHYYFHMSKPAVYKENSDADDLGDKSETRTLSIGCPTSDQGYFTVRINKFNLVEGITCCSKKQYPASNYIQLYNVHEKLLNNLVSRFNEGLIFDFFTFFDEMWTMAIYHDRFPYFRDEARDLLTAAPKGKKSLLDEIRQLIDKNGEISLITKHIQPGFVQHHQSSLSQLPPQVRDSELESLKNRFGNESYKKLVEQSLIDYLRANRNLLPMYALPDMV